jgi:hypothetical protein
VTLLAARLAALERAAVVADPDTGPVAWQEACAAEARVSARAVRELCVAASRIPIDDPLLAGDSPELAEADHRVLDRWREQRGFPEPDPAEVRERLAGMFARLRPDEFEERLDRFSTRR